MRVIVVQVYYICFVFIVKLGLVLSSLVLCSLLLLILFILRVRLMVEALVANTKVCYFVYLGAL